MENIRKELKKLIDESGLDYESLKILVEDVYFQPDNEIDQATLDNLRSQYLNKFVRWENDEAGSVIMFVEKIILNETDCFKFSGRAVEGLTCESDVGQGGFIYHAEFDYVVDDVEYYCPEIISIPEVKEHIDSLVKIFNECTLLEDFIGE